MTVDEFRELELPISVSCQLYVEAGLEWLRDYSTLKFELEDLESVKALPSSVRLFLVKFSELCSREPGIASESVGPMSQSFTADSIQKQTIELARQLLRAYLKPNVTFIPCTRRWR